MIETSYKIPITDGFTPAPSVIAFQRNILDTHNDIQFPSYRAAFKLNELRERTLLCHLDIHGFAVVWQSFEEEMERLFTLKQLIPSEALLFSSNFAHKQEAELSYSNLNLCLKMIYKHIQERSLHDIHTEEARQFLFDFLIFCFDRPVEHSVRANSLQTILVLLCTNQLIDRARYFCRSLSTPDGLILLDVLPFFLCDLFQILDGLGEGPSFGSSLADIEKFRLQCLGRLALHAKSAQREWMSQNEFLALLIQEPVPDCLKWMSVWERIDRTKKDRHKSKCAGCHRTPIVGLRFKCANCRNYNLCQRCFMVRKITGSHKTSHTMREKQLKTAKKSILGNRLLCTTSSSDSKFRQGLVTENPLPHVRTPAIGPTFARSVSRSQSITPSSSQFSLHSLPSSTLTNTSSRRAIKEFCSNIKYEDNYGSIQTNLDDVMTSSPECDFIIHPIIEEGDGDSSPVSPTFTSESSIEPTGQENAFDAIVRDLESWLEDMGKEESPLIEQPLSNPMRIKRETKIAYIPYSDEHLPKLSDLLIAEPVYTRNPKTNVYPRFSPLPRISTSTEDSTDTLSPSQSSTFEDTLTTRPPAPNEDRTTSPPASTVIREKGKFIIKISNRKKSNSTGESSQKKNIPSPSKVYRSISPARNPMTSNSVQKTMLRFQPSVLDLSSTGKGMYRPLPLEGKDPGTDLARKNEEVIWSKTPQKMYGVLIPDTNETKDEKLKKQIASEEAQEDIAKKSSLKKRSKSDAQETPRSLALRLYAYGIEKESPKSRLNSGLSRSNSAHLHTPPGFRPTPLPSSSFPASKTHTNSQQSPIEPRKYSSYVGSAAMKNPHERSISNSLSSLSFDTSIASSASTDKRASDFSHLDYKSVHKGSLGNVSRSIPMQYAQVKSSERSNTDVDSHTLPKRKSDLTSHSLNVAQQSTTTIGRSLQYRINSLLSEAKKHHKPESASNRDESPILRRIREIENMRKDEDKIL